MESDHEEETQDVSDSINVIQVSYDETYPNVESPQANSSGGVIKGKYYKQTYRTAWESMPDFEGWLRGVQGEPTRAYCLYCQKTLHAHRLSLLKHTCTIRHQKAAQLHSIRKAKTMEPQNNVIEVVVNPENNEDSNCAEPEAIIEYTEVEDYEQGESPEPEELEDEETEMEECFNKKFRPQIETAAMANASTKPPMSTHVLDSVKGTPAVGLPVTLYKLIDGRWTYINEGTTNNDGRFNGFYADREGFTSGRYKLHFDVDRFFEAKKQDSMYPFIEIIIDCKSAYDSYHVPLLLSPYSYTTYKGS